MAEYNAEATNKLKDLNLKYFQVEEKLKEVNNLNEDLKNKKKYIKYLKMIPKNLRLWLGVMRLHFI